MCRRIGGGMVVVTFPVWQWTRTNARRRINHPSPPSPTNIRPPAVRASMNTIINYNVLRRRAASPSARVEAGRGASDERRRPEARRVSRTRRAHAGSLCRAAPHGHEQPPTDRAGHAEPDDPHARAACERARYPRRAALSAATQPRRSHGQTAPAPEQPPSLQESRVLSFDRRLPKPSLTVTATQESCGRMLPHAGSVRAPTPCQYPAFLVFRRCFAATRRVPTDRPRSGRSR
jgi:hypothetical protein